MDTHEGGQHKPLPVQRECVGAQVRIERDAASSLRRLQQQMHFRVVPEWLIVADTLDWGSDCFAVDDGRRSERDGHAEAFFREIPDDLSLDLSHDLGGYLFCARIIFDSKHRLLFLKKFQVMQGCHRIRVIGEEDGASKDRQDQLFRYGAALQGFRQHHSGLRIFRRAAWLSGFCVISRGAGRLSDFCAVSQNLTGGYSVEACGADDLSCRSLTQDTEAVSGILTKLINLERGRS